MSVFRVLKYFVGGSVVGIAAIAAAPFTGGGSILGATTLVTSLTGAMTAAAATGAALGGAGAIYAAKKDEDDEEKDMKIAKQNQEIQKLTGSLKEAVNNFAGDKAFFNFIIGATALGVSIANIDGKVSEDEKEELDEFIGGIAKSNYPDHIRKQLNLIVEEKPNFATAIKFLEKIDPSNYSLLRDMLEIVADADGETCKYEKQFLSAYDEEIKIIVYKPESNDTEDLFLKEIKENISYFISKNIYVVPGGVLTKISVEDLANTETNLNPTTDTNNRSKH